VETHIGCCHGLPVIGPTSYTVPPLHGAPASDAGPDGADVIDAPTGSDSGDAGGLDSSNDDA
jgi:hypothetical protein